MNMNSRNVTYSTIGDYQLPNLTLPRQEKTLGKYGRLRRTYLMKHRPVLYNSMLLSGTLHPHLLEVEQTAESRMRQTMQELLKQNPAPNKEQYQILEDTLNLKDVRIYDAIEDELHLIPYNIY